MKKPGARNAPYKFRGLFYEACDCYSICPCWTGNNPDEGEGTGVFAWDIEAGLIDGVEVAGLRVASVSHQFGHRDTAHQRVIIFVDEHATPEQTGALVAALTGNLGGPLGELAGLLGELLGVEHAAITLRREGRLTTLTVGRQIRVEGTASEGPAGHVTTLNDAKLSSVLGTPAEVGVSCSFRVGLPALATDLDLRGRSTMAGRFSYEHTPKPSAVSAT